MYILKNSLISIMRNKGRNILIGIIILVIAASSTVTLSIRNTANNLVKDYESAHDIIATISFNRQELTKNFQGGEDAMKSNIEAFNNIEQLTLENVKNYGESSYLKSYYYMYSVGLNSDTLTKASDSFEYEVENRETTTSSTTTTSGGTQNSGMNRGPGGEANEKHTITNNNTTTVITKSKERFQSDRNLVGDFELDGYSSFEAMTDFVDGTYQVTEGEMVTDLSNYECVINSELATLNEISVGETITLKNPNTEKTYDFTVKGIYKDNSKPDDSNNMYSQAVNKIIVGSSVIENLVAEDNTLITNVTPSFVLNDEESIEKFTEELKGKGLNEYYTVNTNLDELESATQSIENVKTFATTFLVITLIIASIVLFVINMINIRERKYEIGVFRTIGVSKTKLAMQFVLELLIVSIIMLCLGFGIGAFLSKPVGNMLLQNEIEATQTANEEVSNNVGRGDQMGEPRGMEFRGIAKVEQIDNIEAVVDVNVIVQLLGIGILLTIVSSLASMISIQRFSPLTILKERS